MNLKNLAYILIFSIIFFTDNFTYSQSLFQINSDIGGGSNNTQNVSENNDDIMLYVIGGAIVAGIVIYAVLKDKKEKAKDDSTAVILNDDFLEKKLTFKEKLERYNSQIPINVSLGIQNDLLMKDEKRYFVGLSYNF